MRHVTVNFPDEFLARLDDYCERHRMKRNAVLMSGFDALSKGSGLVAPAADTDDIPGWDDPPAPQVTAPSYGDLVALGRLKPALQPGERRIEYDGERKR